jgi:hypothetical protein
MGLFMRLKSLALGLAAGMLAATGLASQASATVHTLTFDASDACATTCVNYSYLTQGYGSEPGLDIHYRSLSAAGNGPVITDDMHYWNLNYGDLVDVAWADGGDCCAVADITFTVHPGYSFQLLDMDTASWPNTDRTTDFRLYDLSYNLIGDTGQFTAPGNGHQIVTCSGCVTTTGYVLQFGPDAYNTGVDNIRFDLTQTGAPEPAEWALMLVGFGALGAMTRLRRAVAA